MKKSELKEIIKANFLAEAEDSKKGNIDMEKHYEGAIKDTEDHIADLKSNMKDFEDRLAKLKKDEPKDVSEEMKKDDVDEAMRGGDDDMDEGMRGKYEEDDTMREAEEVDVEDNEDINVDIEDEVNIDDESDKSEIEVDSELAGESSDTAAVLGLLTKAQEKASAMGDEKLMDQIGNTITYYTRAHVVASTNEEVSEEVNEEEVINEEVNRFRKLAGLIK